MHFSVHRTYREVFYWVFDPEQIKNYFFVCRLSIKRTEKKTKQNRQTKQDYDLLDKTTIAFSKGHKIWTGLCLDWKGKMDSGLEFGLLRNCLNIK